MRGATITVDPVTGEPVDRVPALVRSDGAEVGFRYQSGRQFNATFAVFWLELNSELVFVGDTDTTEPNDTTERTGVELATFWQASDWPAVQCRLHGASMWLGQFLPGGAQLATDHNAVQTHTANPAPSVPHIDKRCCWRSIAPHPALQSCRRLIRRYLLSFADRLIQIRSHICPWIMFSVKPVTAGRGVTAANGCCHLSFATDFVLSHGTHMLL